MRILNLGGLSNNHEKYFKGQRKFRKFDEILAEIEKIDGETVLIQGGEPTIHPDFIQILDILQTRKLKTVLQTNARRFAYGKQCEIIPKDAKVIIELWGLQDLHDKLTRTKGSFEQTINGMKNLISRDYYVSVQISIVKENIKKLREILGFVSGFDIGNIILKPEIGLDKKTQDLIQDLDPFVTADFGTSPQQKALALFNRKSPHLMSIDEAYNLLSLMQEKISFMKLAHKTGYPIPSLVLLFSEFEKQGLVEISKESVLSRLKIQQIKKPKDFSKRRFDSDPEVCQLAVEQNDLEERAKYVAQTCLSGGNIAIIGDDDFFSLILASMGHFDKIVVFEIDKRITDEIQKLANENNYNIHVVHHDLRKQIPRKYHKKFDVFYTDSPYSVNGFTLFVSRGLQLLKDEVKRHGFASFSPELPAEEVELMVQKAIVDMNLFIERKSYGALNVMPKYLPEKFNTFEKIKKAIGSKLSKQDEWNLAVLGRKEFLFHFLTTDSTKPAITRDFDEKIYYENTPMEYYTNQKQ